MAAAVVAQAKPPVYVGVDIGGTTITCAVVDERGAPIDVPPVAGTAGGAEACSLALEDDHEPGSVARRAAVLVQAALAQCGSTIHDVRGVGVVTPGLLDLKGGVVKAAANLRGWKEVPVCSLVAEALGVDRRLVFLEHDTNAALLAEVAIGAAKGRDNVVLMTLGTGVGGAIMCDGRLLRGSKDQAGEIGHSIVCPDGREFGTAGVRGILEGYSSASAVAARANENGGPPETSSLRRVPPPVQCADVFRHAEEGDAFSLEIVRETAKYIAISCINCARFVDPDVIIFAGGMAQAGEFLLSNIREQYAKYHWNLEPVRVQMVPAAAGTRSGAVGAALSAMTTLAR